MYKRITASERSYTRNVLIRSASRNGGENMSAELDGQYKRLRRLLATAWRTKRSGIASELSLSMRVPIVSPANDGYSCRELSLFEWWEKYRRVRKEGAQLIRVHTDKLLLR